MTRHKELPFSDSSPAAGKKKWEKPALNRLRWEDFPAKLPHDLPPQLRDAIDRLAMDAPANGKVSASSLA